MYIYIHGISSHLHSSTDGSNFTVKRLEIARNVIQSKTKEAFFNKRI